MSKPEAGRDPGPEMQLCVDRCRPGSDRARPGVDGPDVPIRQALVLTDAFGEGACGSRKGMVHRQGHPSVRRASSR